MEVESEQSSFLQAHLAELQRQETSCLERLRAVKGQLATVEESTLQAKRRAQATQQQIRKAQTERRTNVETDSRRQQVLECRRRVVETRGQRDSLRQQLDELQRRRHNDRQDMENARKASQRLSEMQAEHEQLQVRYVDAKENNRRQREHLQRLQERQEAILERGTRETQRLGELRQQNDTLAAQVAQVLSDVNGLQQRYWDGVPYRDADSPGAVADIERLRKRALEDETELDALRSELADLSGSIVAAKTARSKLSIRPKRPEKSRDLAAEVEEAKAVAANARITANKVACEMDDATKRLHSSPGMEPVVLDSPDAPPLPATLLQRRQDVLDFKPSPPPPETVLEVADIPRAPARRNEAPESSARQAASPVEPVATPVMGPALRTSWSPETSARADELANVEDVNSTLRIEIAALKEQMEQRRLREEIGQLRSKLVGRGRSAQATPQGPGWDQTSPASDERGLLLPPM